MKPVQLLSFLIAAVASRSILHPPARARHAQVTESVMPQLNLKQLQLLQLIREEDVYSKIQNEKDDDQIYNYGLVSLEHPERMKIRTINASKFPKLVAFFSRLNYFYNLEANLVAFGHPLSEEEKKVEGIEVFEHTKSMLFTVLYEFKGLGEEVELLFEKSDSLAFSAAELIEIYGFKSLFDRLVAGDVANKADTLAKMDLKAYEWVGKVKPLIETVGLLRRLNVPFYYYASEIAEQVEKGFDNKTNEDNVRDATNIIQLLLGLKGKCEYSLQAIERSIQYLFEFRYVLLDLVSRLQPGWYLQEEEAAADQDVVVTANGQVVMDDGSGIPDQRLQDATNLEEGIGNFRKS